MHIGQTLKRLREIKEVPQMHIAIAFNHKQQRISSIEADEYVPVSMVKIYLTVIGVSWEQYVDFRSKMWANKKRTPRKISKLAVEKL